MTNILSDGKYLAFDLGSQSIKAVLVDVKKGNMRLEACEVERVKPLEQFADAVDHENHLVERLRAISKKFSARKVVQTVSVFSHREHQVKIIDLPTQVNEEQLEKVISWEAQKLLSPNYKNEPFIYAYSILKRSPIKVALAVVPKEFAVEHLSLFEKAGIKITRICSEVFAALAMFKSIGRTNLPAVSLLDIGYKGTHLQIFESGRLSFYRYIPSGMSDMSEPPTEDELEIFLQKIRFSFDYFRAVSKLPNIDAIYCAGGGASSSEFLKHCRLYFGQSQTDIVDLSAVIDISTAISESAGVSPEEKQRKFLPCLSATGGFLSLQTDNNNADLLYSLNKANRKLRMGKFSKAFPAIVAIAGLCANIIFFVLILKTYNSQQKKIQQEISAKQIGINAANIKLASLNQEYKDLKTFDLTDSELKVLEPVLSQRSASAVIGRVITCALEAEVKIDEILFRNEPESETISIKTDESHHEEEEEKCLFSSSLSIEIHQETLSESLHANVILIRGQYPDNKALGKFLKSLTQTNIITRIKEMQNIDGSSDSSSEFLIKGIIK